MGREGEGYTRPRLVVHSWGCPPSSNTACSRRLWPSGRHCRAGDWEEAWWRRRSRSARSRKEWLPSEEEPGGNTVINSNVFELVLVDKEAEQEEENVEWCCWGARVVGKRLCRISEGGDILLVDMDTKSSRLHERNTQNIQRTGCRTLRGWGNASSSRPECYCRELLAYWRNPAWQKSYSASGGCRCFPPRLPFPSSTERARNKKEKEHTRNCSSRSFFDS